MTEGADFDPGPWRGHDFSDAYREYDAHVSRSYADSRSFGSSAASSRRSASGSGGASSPTASSIAARVRELLETSVTTDCTNPLIIMCDVTGSMQDWPKTMFSKLPYLETEAKGYLGEDLEICFGAIGDANSDNYPLQVRPFTKGTDLKKRMLELEIEQGGGNGICESYEPAALYAVHNVAIPKAIKPILIMIGDEKPYPFISPDDAERVAGVKIQGRLSSKQVFDQLKKKFSVYMIRKPYGRGSAGSNTMSAEDQEIRNCWVELLGATRVVDLPDAGRVVDVIFGILAEQTGRLEYFKEEIEGRQTREQVATVYKSLASLHTSASGEAHRDHHHGESIMKLEHKGPPTKPLL